MYTVYSVQQCDVVSFKGFGIPTVHIYLSCRPLGNESVDLIQLEMGEHQTKCSSSILFLEEEQIRNY